MDRVLCARCGALLAAGRVEVTASRLAERLWSLTTCGPCFQMLKAAVQLELAGAGPGGHFEITPVGSALTPAPAPADDQVKALPTDEPQA